MDMSWLANEAKQIHAIFENTFFILVTVLLLLGVILEYFKFPLGGVPAFPQLLGRTVVASLILVSVPEIMNALASFTDAMTTDLGGLNQFKFVLARMGEKLEGFTWSWVSVKDSVLLLISFLSFFLLYVTVYIADSIFLFTWMLLYIFSPILSALYVLPMTAGATKKLFSSMIEVCAWKLVWSVLASLLWSFALSKINEPGHDIDFLTAIILNVMLAFSVLLTPKITGSFLGGGVSQMASNMGGLLLGAAALTPTGMIAKTKLLAAAGASFASKKRENQDPNEAGPHTNARRSASHHQKSQRRPE